MLRQMQESPKQFDPRKLKINIEYPEPRNIASGMGFKIQNQQSIIPQRAHSIPQAVQTQEKFKNILIQTSGVLSIYQK